MEEEFMRCICCQSEMVVDMPKCLECNTDNPLFSDYEEPPPLPTPPELIESIRRKNQILEQKSKDMDMEAIRQKIQILEQKTEDIDMEAIFKSMEKLCVICSVPVKQDDLYCDHCNQQPESLETLDADNDLNDLNDMSSEDDVEDNIGDDKQNFGKMICNILGVLQNDDDSDELLNDVPKLDNIDEPSLIIIPTEDTDNVELIIACDLCNKTKKILFSSSKNDDGKKYCKKCVQIIDL